MFKKKKLSSQQLGLLTTALMRNLFPKPIKGELLVEDTANDGCILYFKDDYYSKLFTKIADQVHTGTYLRSNAEKDWMDLAYAIQSASNCETLDTSKLKEHFLSIDTPSELMTSNDFSSNKKIKVLEQQRFHPALPFGWEILDDLWKEILKLDGGNFEETASVIKLTTTANKNIVVTKDKVEENSNYKTVYQGTFDEICSKKMLLVFNKDAKTFEILDPLFPDKSFKLLFSLQ